MDENRMEVERGNGNDTFPDPLLLSMVELHDNNVGFSMGLTVTLPGAVITGTLVGARDYYERSIDLLLKTSPNDNPERSPLVKLYRDFISLMPDQSTEPEFLHLVDATLISGNAFIGNGEGLWRVDLRKISAFTFGQYSEI